MGRRMRTDTWLLALTGAALLACSAAAQTRPAAPAEAPALRVVTYNILAGDRGLKGLTATLKKTKADVIALQEVDKGTRRSGGVDQATALGKALGYGHAFVPHFAYQGGEFGVALLSRHPIVRAERRTTKGSRLAQLDATVRTPDGEVRVVVVHFTVTFPFRDSKEQAATDAARLKEAKAAAALALAEKGPVLVLGDMNDDSGSPAYEAFSKGLQDACEVKGAGFAKTWNSAFPVTRIDYVWASRHFEVASCDTLASDASDHLPVAAELRWVK